MNTMSLSKDKIRILLLEDLHQNAENYFRDHGYTNVTSLKGALDAGELKKAVADVHIIGIRSRTKITEEILDAAKKLMAIGCFCIGTNQVDLEAAKRRASRRYFSTVDSSRSRARSSAAKPSRWAGVKQKDFMFPVAPFP